jgi:hypothetical protein
MKTKPQNAAIVSVCLLVLAFVFLAQAQSGRRKVPTSPAPPVPTPTPEPTPKEKEPEKEPDRVFFVGVERTDALSAYPFTFYDAALSGCMERLRRAASTRVDMTDRDFSRGEAIKKAKADTKAFVVLLSLNGPTMAGSQTDYNQLEVRFTVFSPGTAKIAANGTSYLNAGRAGPLVVGPTTGTNSRYYTEVLVKRAGEDAAERILKSLHIPLSNFNTQE